MSVIPQRIISLLFLLSILGAQIFAVCRLRWTNVESFVWVTSSTKVSNEIILSLNGSTIFIILTCFILSSTIGSVVVILPILLLLIVKSLAKGSGSSLVKVFMWLIRFSQPMISINFCMFVVSKKIAPYVSLILSSWANWLLLKSNGRL